MFGNNNQVPVNMPPTQFNPQTNQPNITRAQIIYPISQQGSLIYPLSNPQTNPINPMTPQNPNIISAPAILTAPKLPPNLLAGPPYQNFQMMLNPMQQISLMPQQQQSAVQNINIKSAILNDNIVSTQIKPQNIFPLMPPGQGFPQLINPNGPMGGGLITNPMMPLKPEKSDALKKVFVKNIPNDVPDEFMESILRECGPITSWKRSKNEKDIPMPFGYCEFETVEGVLRCIRVLNGLKIVDKELQIKPPEKTAMFIKEWKELRRREWELTHKEDDRSERKEFDIFLEKDDADVNQNIDGLLKTLDINKIREEKEREEEKKEHPRERERDSRKRQLKRDNERKFKEKLSDWLRREEDKEKDRKREKEKERDREKDRIRLLDKELTYDSEEEKKRKTMKYQKMYQERKKMRQRELEEDEFERKKELQAQERPPEPEENFNFIKPPTPDREEGEDPDMPKKKTTTFFLQTDYVEQNVEAMTGHQYQKILQFEKDDGMTTLSLDLNKLKSKTQMHPSSNAFNLGADENEDDPNVIDKKHKLLTKLEKNDKFQLISNLGKNLNLNNQENQHQEDIEKNKQAAQAILSNEYIKKELESIILQIPKSKKDLFDYPINWTHFATSNILDKKVKPWLVNKSIEYIGTEEPAFVSMIYKKVANRESPLEIIKKVEKVLDEDAEDFVMKLWRMIIFELLKAKLNI